MTTQTLKTPTIAHSGLLAPAFFIALGLSIIFVSGLSQAAALHDVAHDVRHATGFPCH